MAETRAAPAAGHGERELGLRGGGIGGLDGAGQADAVLATGHGGVGRLERRRSSIRRRHGLRRRRCSGAGEAGAAERHAARGRDALVDDLLEHAGVLTHFTVGDGEAVGGLVHDRGRPRADLDVDELVERRRAGPDRVDDGVRRRAGELSSRGVPSTSESAARAGATGSAAATRGRRRELLLAALTWALARGLNAAAGRGRARRGPS